MALKMNIGAIDAVLRIGFGAVLIYAGIFNTDSTVTALPSIVFVLMGTSFVITGIIRHCPVYHLIGFSSRKKTETSK
jgi:hypothetical protein